MAPKKAKGKQKQEEKPSKAVYQGVTLFDPPVVNNFKDVLEGGATGAFNEGETGVDPYIPTQEDSWGANVHQEIHNWPDVQPTTAIPIPPPTVTITAPVSDTASGHMPTNRLSASGAVNEGYDSWSVNNHEGTENPQTWDTHHSQTSTVTAAPSAITSPVSQPISLSAAAAFLDTQKTSSASEAARKLEAKHGISSHHHPWPPPSNPQAPSHPVPAHRDKVPTSSAMKRSVQQQPMVWRDSKAPSSVQGRTNEGSWGQPHGGANVSWGQTRGSGAGHHQQGQPQHRVVQSWETWGKPPNSVIRVTPPSPESSSEDSDELEDEDDEWETVGHQAGGGRGQPEGNFGQTAGSWGETGGWGQGGQGSVTWGTASPAGQHKQADWGTWGAETKRLPKVTFAPSAPDGSRNILSPQQRSQILNSLLNLPQSQNTKAAQHQHQQKQKAQNQPASNKHTTKQQTQPQWQGWGAEDDWGTQEQSSKKKNKQQQQPQAQSQQQWGSWGEEASWGNPEQASDKKSKKREDHLSVPGQWGDENRWGAAEHGDEKSGRHQQTEGQWGSWGAENAQGTRANKKAKKNPDHTSHNGNWGDDDWGMAGNGGKGANKRQDDANGAWGSWGEDAGWGAIQEETEDEETEDTHHDNSTSKNVWSGNLGNNSYSMPSKTLTHAYKGTTTTLHTAIPRSSLSEHANIQFLESKGVAFQPVTNAFFGTNRLARERIHWMFPSDKDERVAALLIWIQTVSYNLGAFGLHRFLQSRERGALFANAAFRLPDHPKEPVFDWLTFDQLQATKDRTLQESVAFYNPAVQVIVFVYLPSQSGNSVAIWRRKIIVPNNVRLVLQAEINVAMAALRREKDYVVHVDEQQPRKKKSIQISAKKKSNTVLRRANAPQPAPPKPPKKKRKWWNIFG